jgi:succinoglycan biosynthesis protein ExoA
MHDMSAESLPKVTVLMPVRNEAAYIRRSLGAVFAQDYPVALMEVIVADGMSTDDTRAIIESLRSEHPNLQLIDNPGLTVPFGLNRATRLALGEILVRVDGHCEIAPDYVRHCVEHLLNDGVDGVGGPWETVGETATAQSIALAMSTNFGVGGAAFRTHRGGNKLVDTVPFPAYRKSIVDLVGPYDEEQTRDQDDEYNYRIRERGGKLLLADDVRSRYYSRSSLKKLASQYFQYGYWKVRVAQKHPRQMQVRHFVPALFVTSTVGSAVLAPFSRVARTVLAAILGTYAVANASASIALASREGWRHLRVLPTAFFLLHFSYGAGTLVGLIRFAGRWGSLTQRERGPSSG